MAIRNIRLKRPTIGLSVAIPGRPILIGCSSPPAAADNRRSTTTRAATAALIGLLLPALVRDAGPTRFALRPVGFDQLPGWANDAVSAAVPAFLKSCARFAARPGGAAFDAAAKRVDFGRVEDWRVLCDEAGALPPGDDTAARHFFETGFVPFAVADRGEDEGLFTGYFEIELNGSRQRQGPYQTPIYRKPPEIGTRPFPSRAEIEDGALAGRGLELLWVDDPIGAFFLQIQGSGRIRLHSGSTVRIGYDGKNGHPYVPIGRLLIERGVIPRERMSMAAIWDWMRENPERGSALRREDPSYVFFREIAGAGPVGAEGVALTAERSLAVDHAFIGYGIPIWLAADERFAAGKGVRRLVIAQDTGGAIKGSVRGDFFWGTGAAAGSRAGIMNAHGRYYLLLPRPLAARLAPGLPAGRD